MFYSSSVFFFRRIVYLLSKLTYYLFNSHCAINSGKYMEILDPAIKSRIYIVVKDLNKSPTLQTPLRLQTHVFL